MKIVLVAYKKKNTNLMCCLNLYECVLYFLLLKITTTVMKVQPYN